MDQGNGYQDGSNLGNFTDLLFDFDLDLDNPGTQEMLSQCLSIAQNNGPASSAFPSQDEFTSGTNLETTPAGPAVHGGSGQNVQAGPVGTNTYFNNIVCFFYIYLLALLNLP
jgi:hypothetical protein